MSQVMVTTSWDDGHVLDLRVAAILTKYHLTGTFYVSPEDREHEKDARLSDDQIRLLASDFEIGAHTMTHPNLTKVTTDAAVHEIVESKRKLELVTGARISSFCYPYGATNKKIESLVQEAGFTYARTVRRFSLGSRYNRLSAPTSVHAYKHWTDLLHIMSTARFNPLRALNYFQNWDNLAIALFEQASLKGGTFHLWGHSWELEQNNGWLRLERVLQHISAAPQVQAHTNGSLGLSKQKKLMIVTPYFAPKVGGLEHYAEEMAIGALNANLSVVVVTSGESTAIEELTMNGIHIYRLPVQFKVANTPINLRWYKMMKQIIKAESPDIINPHMPVPFLGDIATFAAGAIPTVITYHSGSMKKRNFLLDLIIDAYEHIILPLTLHKATRIICSSDFIRFGFLKRYITKSSSITPGVDANVFKLAKGKNIPGKVLFIGNFSYTWKGLKYLRAAIEQVTEATLTVIGMGDHITQNRVIYRGILRGPEIVAEIQSSSVLVLPSISNSESFGMVLIEAMACGVPVIGSNIGGIPTVIEHDRTGLLVPPRDADALAAAIRRLLTDDKLATRLKQAGYTSAIDKYTWTKSNDLYLAEITKLTGWQPTRFRQEQL